MFLKIKQSISIFQESEGISTFAKKSEKIESSQTSISSFGSGTQKSEVRKTGAVSSSKISQDSSTHTSSAIPPSADPSMSKNSKTASTLAVNSSVKQPKIAKRPVSPGVSTSSTVPLQSHTASSRSHSSSSSSSKVQSSTSTSTVAAASMSTTEPMQVIGLVLSAEDVRERDFYVS